MNRSLTIHGTVWPVQMIEIDLSSNEHAAMQPFLGELLP